MPRWVQPGTDPLEGARGSNGDLSRRDELPIKSGEEDEIGRSSILLGEEIKGHKWLMWKFVSGSMRKEQPFSTQALSLVEQCIKSCRMLSDPRGKPLVMLVRSCLGEISGPSESEDFAIDLRDTHTASVQFLLDDDHIMPIPCSDRTDACLSFVAMVVPGPETRTRKMCN